MELILWRHAEAEDGVPDAERRLTSQGLQQAKRMADWLNARLPENTRIIVSPTKRTQQTAMALDCDFETSGKIAPGARVDGVLSGASWPNGNGAVLVVGHQPTLGAVASLLISQQPTSLSVKKGAVWWFSCKKAHGIEKVVLRAVLSPDLV